MTTKGRIQKTGYTMSPVIMVRSVQMEIIIPIHIAARQTPNDEVLLRFLSRTNTANLFLSKQIKDSLSTINKERTKTILHNQPHEMRPDNKIS